MLRTLQSLPLPLQLTMLFALAHLSWLAFHWGGPQHAALIGEALYQPVVLLCAVASLQALLQAPKPWRWGLGLLATGLLFHSAADLVWAYLELLTATPPYPSVADALYLMAYPFFFLALLHLSALPSRRLETARVALESVVSVTVLASVMWWVFLADLVHENRSSLPTLLIGMAYPLLDLALLLILFIVIGADRRMRRQHPLLIGGFVSMVIADLGFIYLEQTSGYTAGHPVNSFFTLAFVLLALGAWRFSASTALKRLPVSLTDDQGSVLWKMLPYTAVMGLCAVLWWLPDDPTLRYRGMVAGTVLSMLLLMARQALSFSQQIQLTQDLQRYTLDLQQSREQLAHQAQHDGLTNLPNRTCFEQRLTRALSQEAPQPFAVAFIDLDGFKQVNDTYGHEAGDLLLCQVATRLQSVLQAGDTLARQGGDEFLALLTLARGRNARQASEQLLAQFQEPFQVQGHVLRLAASVGVSLYPQDAREAGELRRSADVAMYRAKRAGNNEIRFFSEPGEPPPLASAQQLSRRLRTAFETGQLTLHYQPQFDVKTKQVVAAEALLRWQDAELGDVPPSTFVPLAEDTGLILELGDWVMEQAFEQLNRLRQRNWEGRMAFNLSPVQLAQEHFVDRVLERLERHHLTGKDIEIEITEGTVAHDPEIASKLARLREAGVRLAVDDFGMGHASLLYLLAAEFNVIKIDRQMLNLAQKGEHERRILEALVTFARNLNLQLVAEGVETPAQLQLMQQLGVETVQGYLTGRPQSVETFTRLVDQHPGMPE